MSRAGFAAAGRSVEEADDALRASVRVARQASHGRDVLVAASVGPYGAILHDGSEYRGRYGVSHAQLVDFHSERLAVLLEESPDLLAIETIPDVDEIAALVEVLEQFPEARGWLTVTCRDDAHTSAGQPLAEVAAAVASSPAILAVGVNCTEPGYVDGALTRLSQSSDLPLVAYPNAGGAWDPESGWSNVGEGVRDDLVDLWRGQSSLRLLGGCCGVGPQGISRIRDSLGSVD